jgi:ATP-dependent RNA helicase DDX54/DBP10
MGDHDMEASDSFSQSDEEDSGPGHSFDISSALTKRKPASRKGKMPLAPRESETDDDTELEDMIKNSISRRNTKDGTELLKNTKGKKKITKGEVGGGSFQSMGMMILYLSFLLCV